MGKKHVTVDNNIVQEVYDEDNNNVPKGALPITDVEMSLISQRAVSFSDFEMINGVLNLRAEAADNMKTRVIEGFDIVMFKAFAEIIMDELNILRANDGLPPRTMAQLKTAMKNKLT